MAGKHYQSVAHCVLQNEEKMLNEPSAQLFANGSHSVIRGWI